MLRLLLVLLLCVATGAAWANGLDQARAGVAAQQRGDWSTAANLFDQALAAGDLPDKAKIQVMGLRANAYGSMGLVDKAVAAFSDVIKAAPGDPQPLVGRSIVYRQMAKYDDAIADATAALKIKDDYTYAFTIRGLSELYAARFAQAAEDFVKSNAADPKEPDFVLWLHIARARAGQDDAKELAANAAKLDLKTWSGAAVAMFLGQATPDTTRAAADNEQNPVIRKQQHCEAAYYLGEDALLHAKPNDARILFQEVLDTCAMYKANYAYFSNVYGAAKEELARFPR
jgi:lipoprotein NlpI